MLQLRAKSLESGALLDLAGTINREVQAAGGALIVNDRADVAALAGAAGVHVGQDDLPPDAVRQIVGERALVGLSTHTPAQIEDAVERPVSYIAVGPVFPTETKATGYDQVGLALVDLAARAARARGLPLVAIGGITLATAPGVIAAGASAVAVITDLMGPDPEDRTRQYLAALA